MKKLLAAVCAFTALACAWLLVMFFILRHEGFLWRAAVTAALMAQSAATLATAGGRWRWPGFRPALAVGGAATLLVGLTAFRANESAADWEGYVAIISLALMIQGVLTMAAMVRTPAST